jgi:catechol 2,3-dioxygenase-like lactoylglutathione lyase family enzyme
VATQIHLMPTEEEIRVAGHLGVVCRDFERTMRALEAAGHAAEPRRRHWGAPRAYVRDPAGHLVEVMAWPPQSSSPPLQA